MKKSNLLPNYDPPLISHNRGKIQGQVCYNISVQKDSDIMHLDIENPAMATVVRLSLSLEDANTLRYSLGEAVAALREGTRQ